MRDAVGMSCLMSSSRFADSSSPKSLTPVTFPPGRLRLARPRHLHPVAEAHTRLPADRLAVRLQQNDGQQVNAKRQHNPGCDRDSVLAQPGQEVLAQQGPDRANRLSRPPGGGRGQLARLLVVRARHTQHANPDQPDPENELDRPRSPAPHDRKPDHACEKGDQDFRYDRVVHRLATIERTTPSLGRVLIAGAPVRSASIER